MGRGLVTRQIMFYCVFTLRTVLNERGSLKWKNHTQPVITQHNEEHSLAARSWLLTPSLLLDCPLIINFH